MASPVPIALFFVSSGTTGALSEPSPTLTWQAGDVIAVIAMNEGVSNGITMSIANTGTGLSAWSAAQSHPSASDTSVYAWTTTASANGSGVVTVTQSTNNDITIGGGQFRAPAGQSITVGNSHLSTGQTSAPQQTALPMSRADSAVLWAGADWSAGVTEAPTPTPTSHTTSTPGPSAFPANGTASGSYTWYMDELDDEPSTGSLNFGYNTLTTASAGPFVVVAVEIALVGPPPTPVQSTLRAKMKGH